MERDPLRASEAVEPFREITAIDDPGVADEEVSSVRLRQMLVAAYDHVLTEPLSAQLRALVEELARDANRGG